jgi:signal transduction histidine kinase
MTQRPVVELWEVDPLADPRAEVEELEGLRLEVEELRAARRRLALANGAERRGLERELHEGVQQQLVGLATAVELAAGSIDVDPDDAKRQLAEIAHGTQEALERTRELAHRIYPPLLEAGGLVAAIRSAAAYANVPIRIDVEAEAAPPQEVAGVVYFCCLDVIERLAAGTPTAVTVRTEEDALAFELVVDGAIDVDALRLRDRVEALGGALGVVSASGGRGRVAGSLPLSE